MPNIAVSNAEAGVPVRPPQVLVLACGALAREIIHLTRLNGWNHVTLECLPAKLHHVPDKITPALEARLDAIGDKYDKVLIGYADCGTGGHLDAMIEGREGVERLPGAHCYEFFATTPVFMDLHEAELGTFYLTDFLVKHFDRFVIEYLGLDRHPQLRNTYFGNYRKLVYLSQVEDDGLVEQAKKAADRLGLAFSQVRAGYGDLQTSLESFVQPTGPEG
jgi:hypothetical protein